MDMESISEIQGTWSTWCSCQSQKISPRGNCYYKYKLRVGVGN